MPLPNNCHSLELLVFKDDVSLIPESLKNEGACLSDLSGTSNAWGSTNHQREGQVLLNLQAT